MNMVLDLFTKREIIIIGAVVGALILIVLVITLIDILSKRKRENEELEMAFDDVDVVPIKIDKSVVEKVQPDVSNNEKIEVESSIKNISESEVNHEVIESNKEEIVIEEPKAATYIEPIIIDIDEVQETNIKNDSMTMAQIELEKIEKELENPKSLEDTLYDLEAIEEENAIISYQELLENTKELNFVATDSGDEIISLKEMINMYDDSSNESESIDIKEEMTKVSIDDAYKGDFTSTPILSPIMGLEQEKINAVDLAEIQLENTANLEKLDKELRKTNQFLSILNDLKKNLD